MMVIVVVPAHRHRMLVVRVMSVVAQLWLSVVVQVVVVVFLVLRLHVMHICTNTEQKNQLK